MGSTHQDVFKTQIDIVAEMRKIDSTMPIQTFLVFLIIASEEGLTLSEIAQRAGLSQSSASRNFAALSVVSKSSNKGLGLITTKEDPEERRRKIARLTAKGKRLSDALVRLSGD
jgi:DNA-binding MarR family transcriptional regulator